MGFQDKLVFDDGEHRVELTRMGPGHTLGDAIAYLPKEKILFTGDLCVNFAGNNIADRDPPVVSSTAGAFPSISGPALGNGNTFPQVYDTLGRFFFLSATAKF